MTTFLFGFCLSGFLFPQLQNFPSKKRKKNPISLCFSLLHPNFLRTGARYLPDKGILFDQSCNTHSMQCCVSAEHISHSFVQDQGSRVTEDNAVQCFHPHPLPILCTQDQLPSVINSCSVLLREHWGSPWHCFLRQPWDVLRGGRTRDFWNLSGIRGTVVQMNIFWRLKDFWFSLFQLCASCILEEAYRPRAEGIRKLTEL